MTAHASSSPAPCPHCGYAIGAAGADLCPNCGQRLQWRESDPLLLQSMFQPASAIKSLLVRGLIGIIVAPWLVYASVWLSMIFGSAKIQATPAIMLGLVFGYGFGYGLAERAGYVNAIMYILLTTVITAIVAAASLGMLWLFPDLLARAGEKRYWFAAGGFSGTTLMCALIALRWESNLTNPPIPSTRMQRPD